MGYTTRPVGWIFEAPVPHTTSVLLPLRVHRAVTLDFFM